MFFGTDACCIAARASVVGTVRRCLGVARPLCDSAAARRPHSAQNTFAMAQSMTLRSQQEAVLVPVLVLVLAQEWAMQSASLYDWASQRLQLLQLRIHRDLKLLLREPGKLLALWARQI